MDADREDNPKSAEYNAVMKFSDEGLRIIEEALDQYDAYLINERVTRFRRCRGAFGGSMNDTQATRPGEGD